MPGLQRARGGDEIEILRLDRPERRNALDSATLAAFLEALDELAADTELRVLVVSTTSTAIEAFPAVTVAVCVGHCVGAGAELAAGCDLRVGGDNLKLAWAGARLGVPVGVARLVPLVGLSRAKELVFTGRVVGMQEALALGLLARTAPAEQAEAVALELAREIAAHPPEGLRVLKRMFRDFEQTAERVARENLALESFQREGAGLPQGR